MRNEVVCWGLTRAAEELDMSISMLKLLADRGALPSFRDSAMRRMFLPLDVANFKEERAAKAAKGKPKLNLSRRAE